MEFNFIKHSVATKNQILEIVNLKQSQWNYSVEENLMWINKNILSEDIHVIMSDRKENLAYMNLVKVQVSINNNKLPFFGIGNVCAKEKGKGYGKKILIGVNNYLNSQNSKGILFCKEELVDFYKKCDWNLVSKSIINRQNLRNINVMTFNVMEYIYTLNYEDRNF